MKYVDEFRDGDAGKRVLARIAALAERVAPRFDGPTQLMEVCGGHTHTIFRYGIAELLPDTIELVHGPGCPVCVLPIGRVDDCIALAQTPNVILASFGDAMRVPGSRTSLLGAKAEGADVRTVYSPLDALQLATQHVDKQVVFFALGFETTMPSTALTLLQAAATGVENFSLFCNHITIIPAMRAILDTPDLALHGFIAPGHVSTVIGSAPYSFIADEYRRPLVVTGFEPLDVLQGIWMLLEQLAAGEARVENQYGRVVSEHGNARALAAIAEVFELREHSEWRGLGSLAHSGVKIREAYARFDAERRFALPHQAIAEPAGCQCSEVLTGKLRPQQCRLFGRECTPQTPMGALMVSSEGACAAYHRFGRVAQLQPLLGRRAGTREA